LVILVTPIVLGLLLPRFFQIPYITWYLLHFGIGALALVVLAGLALAGSLTAPLIAIFSGLFGFIFGASAARSQQAAPGKTLSIRRVVPQAGPAGGYVTLLGESFDPQATVRFGDQPLTDVTVSNDGSMLTGRLPAQGQGQVDVVVHNQDGSGKTLTGGFTYS
jgi:hypothetical protein